MTDLAAWLTGRIPDEWFTTGPRLTLDRDEVLVVGDLEPPAPAEGDTAGAGGDTAGPDAEQGRIARFREQTRDERIRIAREIEQRDGRKVAWGAHCGSSEAIFTSLAAPVMTRLRQPERITLDTLVDAGVARSRSHALAWCVRLVGQHTADWLAELRTAMADVERVRNTGPDAPAG
jgi:hypothetical protein